MRMRSCLEPDEQEPSCDSRVRCGEAPCKQPGGQAGDAPLRLPVLGDKLVRPGCMSSRALGGPTQETRGITQAPVWTGPYGQKGQGQEQPKRSLQLRTSSLVHQLSTRLVPNTRP